MNKNNRNIIIIIALIIGGILFYNNFMASTYTFGESSQDFSLYSYADYSKCDSIKIGDCFNGYKVISVCKDCYVAGGNFKCAITTGTVTCASSTPENYCSSKVTSCSGTSTGLNKRCVTYNGILWYYDDFCSNGQLIEGNHINCGAYGGSCSCSNTWGSDFGYCGGGTIEQTCSQKNGKICLNTQYCTVSLINAKDTGNCCLGECKTKLEWQTCSQRGGEICLYCASEFVSSLESPRCCLTGCTTQPNDNPANPEPTNVLSPTDAINNAQDLADLVTGTPISEIINRSSGSTGNAFTISELLSLDSSKIAKATCTSSCSQREEYNVKCEKSGFTNRILEDSFKSNCKDLVDALTLKIPILSSIFSSVTCTSASSVYEFFKTESNSGLCVATPESTFSKLWNDALKSIYMLGIPAKWVIPVIIIGFILIALLLFRGGKR
jgi:hypothetical protein